MREPLLSDPVVARAILALGSEAVLLADDERRYVDANASACELLGRTRDEICRLRIDDLAVAGSEEWVPTAWDGFREDGSQRGSMLVRRPDGTVRHVEFTARTDVVPGIHVAVLRDVTSLVLAQAELRRTNAALADALVVERDRAERSEAQLLLALGGIPTAVWTQDVDLRYTYVSHYRFGLTPETVLGRSDLELFPPEAGEAVTRIKRTALATGTRVDDELLLPYPEGLRVVQISVAPLLARDGSPLGLIGATTDVTAFRDAERVARIRREDLEALVAARTAELAESERRLRELIDGIDAAIGFAEARRLRVSPRFAAILGWSPDEITDFASWEEKVHPDDYARCRATWDTRDPGWTLEYRMRHRDGRWIWVRDRGRRTWAADGSIDRLFFVLTDVTALHDAEAERQAAAQVREAAVRESEARYRRLIESQDAFFWEEDAATRRIAYISPQVQRLTGHTADDFYTDRRLWRRLIHPEDAARVVAAFGEPREATLDYRIVRADGSTAWVRDHTTRIVDDDGRHVRTMGIVTDVTSLRAAEEERRAISARTNELARLEALARMAATTAHDFGNILVGIDVFAAFLAADPTLGERGRRDVGRIRAAVEHGGSVARSLVSLGRLAEVRIEPTDVHATVERLRGSLQALLGSDVTLEVELATGEHVVELDPAGLERALINLVVNARDALPDGGRVVLRTGMRDEDAATPTAVGVAHEGRYLAIEVADDGVGMDAATLARAFEPYFTTKPVGRGTGLGLSSVHALVRAVDGHVHAASAPGAGTSFVICVPLGRAPAQS